eukprot:3986649-Amphidinium_carterae.1
MRNFWGGGGGTNFGSDLSVVQKTANQTVIVYLILSSQQLTLLSCCSIVSLPPFGCEHAASRPRLGDASKASCLAILGVLGALQVDSK